MRVYHFLPAEFALASISLKRIKIARLSEVNDPFELQALNVGGRKKFRAALSEWKGDLDQTKGMLCFSKSWQDPVLWSHYANRHHGICLGFDVEDELVPVSRWIINLKGYWLR